MAPLHLSGFISFLFVLLPLLGNAVPVKRQAAITALSSTQIASFRPFSHFASVAYCQPAQTLAWSCGANCDANPNFKPTASGGDGSSVQFWYVGFDPDLQTVIVAHQGTDPDKIQADLTDIDVPKRTLNSTLFPGVDSSIEVHDGFADEHEKTASSVLAAVQKTIQDHGVNKVTVVGHSLGAALALLDSVFLPLQIPNATFATIGYGMPRVGNQAFADYVDAHVTLTRVNNQEDLVPIVPGRFLGYVHASGEKHIQDDLSWLDCPGQDNTDSRCSTGDVSNILEGDINNHDGPYDGVMMGTAAC
ncbi:lipase class 3 family protein [Cyathus striatus]|nr:lipase class 3 family protein [Cyathus striatus]